MYKKSKEIEYEDLTLRQRRFIDSVIESYKGHQTYYHMGGRQTGKTATLKVLIKKLKEIDRG